jgi:hypothetical protein
MREIEIDFDDAEFFDVMINELEKEYGRSVARLAKLERTSPYSFEITVVFSDFRLLEAEVKVTNISPYYLLEPTEPIVTIRGEYY